MFFIGSAVWSGWTLWASFRDLLNAGAGHSGHRFLNMITCVLVRQTNTFCLFLKLFF